MMHRPNTHFVYMMPSYRNFGADFLPNLQSALGKTAYEFNLAFDTFTLMNGSSVRFVSLNNTPYRNIDSLKGASITGDYIDGANSIDYDDYRELLMVLVEQIAKTQRSSSQEGIK